MTIQEMLSDAGLSPRAIGLLLYELKAYNEQHPDRPVPELNLHGPIDELLLTQLPFVGRAIAAARGDQYLDSEGKFPLSADDNALRYAFLKLDKYYGKDGKSDDASKH